MKTLKAAGLGVCLLALLPSIATAQSRPQTTPQEIRAQFHYINSKILDMAKDFPADKYDFRLKPEMRSFGDVIVHVASGNVYAAKAGRGEKVNWDELDPKKYQGKDQIAALFEKSAADAEAVLKNEPDAQLAQNVNPWLAVLEHSGEHYGLLVAYYRANGIVPPASRPKK
jgi:hypothetical protein